MNEEDRQYQYLSVTGNTLLLPLFTMVYRLLRVEHQSTPAKANERESGWALSSIAIAAVMLESWLVRAQWDLRQENPKWLESALHFYNTLRARPDLSQMPDIAELFLARDLIFHNHLYIVTGQYAPSSELLDASFLRGRDAKLRKLVDPTTYRTRTLGLNVIPSRITRRDVAIFLRTMVSTLRALTDAKLLMSGALTDTEAFGENGDRRTLGSVVVDLENSPVPMVEE